MSRTRTKNYSYEDDDYEDDYEDDYYEQEEQELSSSQKEKYLKGYKSEKKTEKQTIGKLIETQEKKKNIKDDSEQLKKSISFIKEKAKQKFKDEEIIDALQKCDNNSTKALNFLYNNFKQKQSEKGKPIFETHTKDEDIDQQDDEDEFSNTSLRSRVHPSMGLSRGRGRGFQKDRMETKSIRPLQRIFEEEIVEEEVKENLDIQEGQGNIEKPSDFGQCLTSSQTNSNILNIFSKKHTITEFLPLTDIKPYEFKDPSPDDLHILAQQGKILTKEHEIAPIKKKEVKPKEIIKPKIEKEIQIIQPLKKKPPPEDKEKARISVVVIGHVDAGKSTLMGHLLYDTGVVNQKTIHKYEKESNQMGKSSFHFAWVLDEHDEERERGVTIDIGVRHFETNSRNITILDAPGHKDFIPNMINGTSQADFAILVVDSIKGAFESGFQDGGQTKEHLILARSLGISKYIVAVNKLDKQDWSKDRFLEIKEKIESFMKQIGVQPTSATFIPCSGLAGDNLSIKSKNTNWYDGPTILECIDKMEPNKRSTDKGLRMSISDVFKSSNVTICGKIESGTLQIGDNLLIVPNDLQFTVKTITRQKKSVKVAYAGDNVELGINGVDIQNISIGQVICEPFDKIKLTNKFRAKIITFDLDYPIIKGTEFMFHYQNVNVPATVYKIYHVLDKNMEILKKKPKALTKNMTAEIQIRTKTLVPIELYSEYKAFGRFMLRVKGKTVGAGMITKVSRISKKSLVKTL